MSNKAKLQELFTRAYGRGRWLEQLHAIFAAGMEVFSSPHCFSTRESKDKADRQRLNYHLGKLITGDSKQLGIFEIRVAADTRLARNRVQLRNLVARQVRDNALDGALAVYYDTSPRWRFSYIAVTPQLDNQDRPTKKETAYKRYTYLLGEGAQIRTAVERFAKLIEPSPQPSPKREGVMPPALDTGASVSPKMAQGVLWQKVAGGVLPVPTLDQLSQAFEVEPLNKEFYQKLYEWYQRARGQVSFPNDEGVDKDTHIANSLIRLLTRLLFVWFVKEKRLINPDLFDPDKIKQLIDWEKPSSYYKAVLQNLFFATLNREIKERQFRTTTNGKANRNNYAVTNLYRYQSHFKDGNKDDIIALFAQTPFLNGGLFECLDRQANEKEIAAYERDKTIRNERKTIRMDGFSDRDDNKLSVPNDLFFNEDEGQPGLINLLSQYQFTIEESAPLDIEVALDPELLGLVFENLLAAYNPETRDTARKQTGSYYTPRKIVAYMVDESLKAHLAQAVPPEDGDTDFYRERLDDLFIEASRTGELSELKKADGKACIYDEEIPRLIEAISKTNILDPAVGSGAFPMGALQRMVSLLAILDSNNKQWKKQQLAQLPSLQSIEKDLKTAGDISDRKARDKAEAELRKREQEIKKLFDRQDHNYLRKLYLIENCLFGVDIQPIAIQIAKLRFFISLVIEQNLDRRQSNYGILALPNLETKFIAANSLIGLSKPKQGNLRDDRIEEKEKKLQEARHKHFTAKTLKTKRKHRGQDEQLRGEIAELLQRDGWKGSDASKIVHWNPYNQNAQADWFEPEWMFGVRKGFDVVIGNPPYVESRNSLLSNKLKNLYGNQILYDWKETLPRGSDLLIYFYARSSKLLSDSGQGCFITQNAWLSTDYGQKFQKFSVGKFSFRKIIDTSSKFFSNTKSQNINAVITFFTAKSLRTIEYGVANSNMTVASIKNIKAKQIIKWGHLFSMPQFFEDILSKMSADAGTGNTITFGQGLNFPLRELNTVEAKVPVIVKTSNFVATSADGQIHQANRSKEKIPALILPRGVGNKHYCTFNLCKAFSYSHVELYLPSDLHNSGKHYCLWLYLNSSFVWLFREITGRKNLGGGLLKAEATDMKALPIDFDFNFSQDSKKVFDSIKNREPMPVLEEIQTQDHLLIDEIVADYFDFADMQQTIRDVLVEQVNFRLNRA